MRQSQRSCAVVLLVLALAWATAAPAAANWLTKALDHAGDSAGKGAMRGLNGLDPDLGTALSHVKALPERADVQALAAEAGQEGHWRFVNARGETFTAASADELARVRESLLPGTTGKLALYLTPDTIFAQRALLADLPEGSEIFIATRSGTHRVVREGGPGGQTLLAEIRPNLRVQLISEDLFAETLFQLGQPLKPSSLRILALETGSADALTALPRFDSATRMALVDRIDPARLATSLQRVRGQTVILTGNIEEGTLRFIDAGGGSGSLPLDAVRAAARDADVNLVIVKAVTPRQPGGRNWLWQTTSVPGLDAAVKQPIFGDFLAAIGAKDTPLTVTSHRDGAGRVVLDALPPPLAEQPITDALTGWVDAMAGEALGRIAVAGIEADVRDKDRQTELDRRIIPGLPSWIPIAYLLALCLAVFDLGTVRRWWSRLWPPEDRAEYGGALGYWLARGVRGLLFVLVFLPVVGVPAFVRYLGVQAWAIVTAPVRLLRWLRGRLAPRAG